FVSGSTVPPGVAIIPPPSGQAAAARSHSATVSTSSSSGIVAPSGAQRPRKSKWDTTQPTADDHSSKRSRFLP
ncbi:hypothetical protein BG015_004328, partial [Linnemannia schmuckeri]